MHQLNCELRKPHRSQWNETSYGFGQRPRAVKIVNHNRVPKTLGYITANNKTMAISYDWSHGQ